MATSAFSKYNQFIEDFGNKVHDLVGTAGSGADTLKVMLTNTLPVAASHAVKADAVEIGAGNGYPAGGVSIANVGSRSAGVLTVVATDVIITASGGTIGPFRYQVIYNDTPSSPLDPLVGWFDYGSSITLADTETFTVDFGANLFTMQ
jgi:hypothetical protein